MWQLLLHSQVLKAALMLLLIVFPMSAAVHHKLLLSPSTDTTNWSGVRMEWTAELTRPAFSSQEARTATSSCTTPQRSWLERAM